MSERVEQPVGGFVQASRSLIAWLGWAACLIASPLARVALAVPFLRSGFTKWSGFLTLSPAAEFLFEDQFKLHRFAYVDRSVQN